MIRYNVNLDNMDVNIKFLINLQPEWKQYVKPVKQTKELEKVNINQLYEFLRQNEDQEKIIKS